MIQLNPLKQFVHLAIVLLLFSSCNQYKQLAYFNNISDSAAVYQKGVDLQLAKYQAVTIKPNDIISVIVTTNDPENRMTDAINQLSLTRSGSVSNSSQTQAFNNNIQGILVDKQGNIELPLIGPLHVEGLTTGAAGALIKEKAARLFKEPTVNVRLLNFSVTVLGEVNRPGAYSFSNERVSVLDALSLAGDLTAYGRRNNIMVIREVNNHKKAIRMNLNDAAVMASPYFYLQQNDVVYIEPVRNRAVQSDATTTRTISIVTGAVSVLAVILSFLAK